MGEYFGMDQWTRVIMGEYSGMDQDTHVRAVLPGPHVATQNLVAEQSVTILRARTFMINADFIFYLGS